MLYPAEIVLVNYDCDDYDNRSVEVETTGKLAL
jgi:hypothetical protein